MAGMELRPPDPERDFDEVLALVQACDRAVYGDSDWTAEELREEWEALDLERDAWMGNWGWIGTLAVRPAWRRRGLGLALLQESFGRFYARGERTVALGVDAQNPTGPTRLYERAGMGVLWQADVWQKELRAGS
jgi:GNAT superfamily N-acetyltransferase